MAKGIKIRSNASRRDPCEHPGAAIITTSFGISHCTKCGKDIIEETEIEDDEGKEL